MPEPGEGFYHDPNGCYECHDVRWMPDHTPEGWVAPARVNAIVAEVERLKQENTSLRVQLHNAQEELETYRPGRFKRALRAALRELAS